MLIKRRCSTGDAESSASRSRTWDDLAGGRASVRAQTKQKVLHDEVPAAHGRRAERHSIDYFESDILKGLPSPPRASSAPRWARCRGLRGWCWLFTRGEHDGHSARGPSTKGNQTHSQKRID